MKNTEATKNLQEATEARRTLQSATIRNESAIAEAIQVERMARYEVEKFQIATMAEGFKWNR